MRTGWQEVGSVGEVCLLVMRAERTSQSGDVTLCTKQGAVKITWIFQNLYLIWRHYTK
jgi:hypothetical protein